MDAVDWDVLLVGRQAIGLQDLKDLLEPEACAATWPPGEAPDRALVACQVAMEASPLPGLGLADAAGQPAECLAFGLQIGRGLADQACVTHASGCLLEYAPAAELTHCLPWCHLVKAQALLELGCTRAFVPQVNIVGMCLTFVHAS